MTRLRMVVFGGIYLLCAGLPMCFAASPSIPIEGTMLVSASDWVVKDYAYFMHGTSDNITPAPEQFFHGDISPSMEKVVYSIRTITSGVLPTAADIWVANIDGSDAVNLTELAGLEGVSCRPDWSPDAQKITFQRSEPGELRPCDGFEVWVMDADGTDAHRVTPEGPPASWNPTWSPNGYRLTCTLEGLGAYAVDVDGTDLTPLPNVADSAAWSPDGAKIASSAFWLDTEAGEPGVWRELWLTNADGSNRQVLVGQFVTDADIEYHLSRDWPPPAEGEDRVYSLRAVVGPINPEWSPSGDYIVFQAALPFDPDGDFYSLQVELWLYEVATGNLTQLTDNVAHEIRQSWNGPNTFPDDPEVTVDNVTVTFSVVIGEGVTTIMRDDDPPDVPTGFEFDYNFYELNTTAEVTGPVTICMTYTDEEVPPEAEGDLAILHYDEAQQVWEDITTSRDTVNNIVCGETDSLSPIALHGIRATRFPDVPAWGFGTSGLDPHWAYYHVMACVEAGVVGGYEDGTYQPTGVVTRDQMAVYVARALAGGDDSVPEFTETPTFPDVGEGFWALDYVEYAVEGNVVAGYEDGRYHPEYQVDRGQMAVYVARARGWVGLDDDMTTAPELFPDVPAGFWSGTAIEACVTNGVVQGYLDGYYHPQEVVTRDQMAVYVARGFGLVM